MSQPKMYEDAASRIVDVKLVYDKFGVYRLTYSGRNIAPNTFDAGFGVATVPPSVQKYIIEDAEERGYTVKHLNAFSTDVVSARVEKNWKGALTGEDMEWEFEMVKGYDGWEE